jgi:hypothetical protein
MKTFVNILLITFLSACGGGSEAPEVVGDNAVISGDETEVVGDNAVISGDETEVVGDNAVISGDETEVVGNNNQSNNENLVKLNDEASALLTSFVSLRQKSFYEEFEAEQRNIAVRLAASGRLSSGDHIIAIEDIFETMLAAYRTQFEDDILAIHSNGYLTSKAVDNEIKSVKQAFELYINTDVVTDYDYHSQNVLNILSNDLHDTLDDTFSLLRLELQNFGVL